MSVQPPSRSSKASAAAENPDLKTEYTSMHFLKWSGQKEGSNVPERTYGSAFKRVVATDPKDDTTKKVTDSMTRILTDEDQGSKS